MRHQVSFRAPLRKIMFRTTEMRPVIVDHLSCGHKAERRFNKKRSVQMRFCEKCWSKQQ